MTCPRLVTPIGLTSIGIAPIGILLGVLALAGCTGASPSGQAQADAETRAACQRRAEQAYEQQNRAQIYSPPPTVNTPYSANYTPSLTDRGLSDLFAHDRLVSDCIRNTGSGGDRTVPAAAPGQ